MSVFWMHDFTIFVTLEEISLGPENIGKKCYEELTKAEEYVVKMGDQLQNHGIGTPEIVCQILVLKNCSLLNSNACWLLESFSSSGESEGPLLPETLLGENVEQTEDAWEHNKGAWGLAPGWRKEEPIKL